MNDADRAELRKLAEAALEVEHRLPNGAAVSNHTPTTWAFKGACSPAAVLALLDDRDRLAAENARLKESAALQWEADHQRRVLQFHGLAEEFPFGCDAIDHVAEALLAARAENAIFREVWRLDPEDAVIASPGPGELLYGRKGQRARASLTSEEVVRLDAENTRLRAALGMTEWGAESFDGTKDRCPVCGAVKVHDHFPGCVVAAALAPREEKP